MLTVLSKVGVVFIVAILCMAVTGLVAHVYQDMLYAGDRIVFTGTPAQAWQLYFNLTSPPTNLRTADLIW